MSCDRQADQPAGRQSEQVVPATEREPHFAEDLVGQLEAVVGAAMEVLHVDAVGVMVVDEKNSLRTVASSGPAALEFQLAQSRLGEGPAADAMRATRPIAVESLREVSGYQPLRDLLADQRIEGVLSAPISAGGTLIGNLNAMTFSRHAWSAAELQAVATYADVLGTLLQLAVTGRAGVGS